MFFKDSLSKFWNFIQQDLFPQLEEYIGELSPDHKKLIAVLELIRIEDFIPEEFTFGRPIKERKAIARANIAKILFKYPHTKQLVKHLNRDKQLRIICGFNAYKKVPSESTFSRAFKEFSDASLPEKIHSILIKELYKDILIENIVIDSTPLEVREKALKKDAAENRKKSRVAKSNAKKAGELSRRQKQLKEENLDKMILDLPKHCDKGMKKSAQGYPTIWKGFKLHTVVDDFCIPLAAIVTSASLNDCEAAIPLISKSHSVASNLYDLMDGAYDHPEIKEHSISLGHVPIIDQCPHGSNQKIEKETERQRKKTLNFQTVEDRRYKRRFAKERFNALYKDYYGGFNIFYRGYSKVTCHVMFGVLAFSAATIIKLIQ